MSIIEPREKKVLTKESIMSFGQYKGESASWVLEFDPQYLYWVWQNIEWLEFDVELEEEVIDNTFDNTMREVLEDVSLFDYIGDD